MCSTGGVYLLMRVLDAGRIAPSAKNLQDWKFIVVRDGEKRRRLAEAAMGQAQVAAAPVVIVKSIFKPLRSLSKEAYCREQETHEKCKALIKLVEELDVVVHVPKVCIVETAAVAKRLGGRSLAARASNGIAKSYNIADEETIFNIAWEVALETGCTGFDSYFIAILFTDDSGMNHHAEEAGVTSILIRSSDLKTLEQRLE